MKRLLLPTAVIALTAAASLSPALAEGPKWSGNNTIVSEAPVRAPHYEWQYGYVGTNHPRYEAHWVLVP
jgi:hypothetical protein